MLLTRPDLYSDTAEWCSGEEPAWPAPELPVDEGWVLVLDAEPEPGDEWPVYSYD